MLALLGFFFELARLRRLPQDLPASAALLVLGLALNMLFGVIGGMQIFGGIAPAFGASILDSVLVGVALLAVLQAKGHSARWLQVITVIYWLGALVGAARLVINQIAQLFGVIEIAVLVDLILAVWLHLALGHVLRHALDVPLIVGVLIALGYTILAFNLISGVFPLVLPG